MTTAIKYLFQSFKSAKDKGLLNSYLFYLQVKTLPIKNGEITKSELTHLVKTHLSLSSGATSQNIKCLIKIGFIDVYRHDNNKDWKCIIRGYKAIWNKLGFRLDEKKDNSYRFVSVDCESSISKQELRALIFTIELQRNKQDQDFIVGRRLDRKIEYQQKKIEKEKSQIKVQERKNKLVQLLKLRSAGAVNHRQAPMTNMISCRKASGLLGYKTGNPASKQHKRAQKLCLLEAKRGKPKLVAAGISKKEFFSRDRFKFKGMFWKYGKVFQPSCNTYQFLVPFLEPSSKDAVTVTC